MPNRGGHQPDRPGQRPLACRGGSIELLIPSCIHGSRLTLCRREVDSNPRSPRKHDHLENYGTPNQLGAESPEAGNNPLMFSRILEWPIILSVSSLSRITTPTCGC